MNPWTVILSNAAHRDLRRLDRDVAARVSEALHGLAETGHGDLRRVRGKPGRLALRVGD